MGIYIKGMEMPKNCDECRFVDSEFIYCHAMTHYDTSGTYYTGVFEEKRADFCPLIEVPTPHGRLIDADELLKTFRVMGIWGDARVRGFINAIPTIIESEE